MFWFQLLLYWNYHYFEKTDDRATVFLKRTDFRLSKLLSILKGLDDYKSNLTSINLVHFFLWRSSRGRIWDRSVLKMHRPVNEHPAHETAHFFHGRHFGPPIRFRIVDFLRRQNGFAGPKTSCHIDFTLKSIKISKIIRCVMIRIEFIFSRFKSIPLRASGGVFKN